MPVIIVSYESLRLLADELGTTQVGLLLADEAHRLKNAQNTTYTTLNALNVKRRVLLTGTPVQNDLTEYYSLLNFANPGLLGTRLDFRRNFENAILRGRDADATDLQKQACETKLKELIALVNKFVIRRTNDLLTKYCLFFLPNSLTASDPLDKCRSSTSTSSFAPHHHFRSNCTSNLPNQKKFEHVYENQVPTHSWQLACFKSFALIQICSTCQTSLASRMSCLLAMIRVTDVESLWLNSQANCLC